MTFYSPIEDLNAAIQSYNPFPRLAIVREQDVWDNEFPDVTTLNAHASDAIFKAIEQVRTSSEKVTSLLITASRGSGKSHVLSRIRRRLELKGTGLFVYAGVEKYDLNLVNYEFLQSLAYSLDYTGSEGVTQWQELAASMANQVWKSLNPNAETVPAKKVVETFNDPNNLVAQNKKWVDDLSSKFRKTKRSDPYITRAIFWTLSEEYALPAVRWLSGKALAEVEVNAMGLPNYSNEERYQNSEAFNTVSQILSLISEYKPVVICFDEIEPHKNQCNDAGLTTPHLVAGLIKALVDDVKLSRQSQGIVIVTVMIPDTWTMKIQLMPGGILDRVCAKGDPINLHLMDGDSIVQLVTLWLKDFYQERNLKPHFPVYPFEESQLKGLEKGNSVRAILKWCSDNFKVPNAPPPPPPPDKVELAFNKELVAVEQSIQKLLEDKAQLANALHLVFSTVIGQTIEKVTIQGIEEVEPKKENNGYIDFKIIGIENGKLVKIGVSIIQQSNGTGVFAGLKKLINYKKFNLTRGCLVRSKEINRTATQAQQYLTKLQSPELGGKWVKVTTEDIKPLLAILFVSNGMEDYELTKTQIMDFITQKKLAAGNSLVCDIVRPYSQVSSSLVD